MGYKMVKMHLSSQAMIEGVEITLNGMPSASRICIKQHDSHGLQIVTRVVNDGEVVSYTSISPEVEENYVQIGEDKVNETRS
jgi:hypothetical protein